MESPRKGIKPQNFT